MIVPMFAALLAAPQEDAAAREALARLAERLKDARTLSARVVQERKTALLEEPLRSSGTLYYRREPARLVLVLSDPRPTIVHLDRSSYQVYRPDEKRLERFDFEDPGTAPRLLAAFEPRSEEIGKAFVVRRGEAGPGETEIVLEPRDEKLARRIRRLALRTDAEGGLRRIVFTDPEGDEVSFALSEVRVHPELPADVFELRVPEGTRILRHTVPADKDAARPR
jgi:outer membrane lipoprotein-sorting protein